VPTRGSAPLLDPSALRAMRTSLIPGASLVTANVAEAEALTGLPVRSVHDASDAARAICALGARAALVKGGHLDGPHAVDILAIDGDILAFRAKRMRLPPLHGGGCTLASLIAGRMAKDPRAYAEAPVDILVDAVRWAKSKHGAALAKSRDVGGAMRVLVP
jgi:hydroxymethylpyrimidine/phosphomethylpyrimidine kinase